MSEPHKKNSIKHKALVRGAWPRVVSNKIQIDSIEMQDEAGCLLDAGAATNDNQDCFFQSPITCKMLMRKLNVFIYSEVMILMYCI